MWLVCTVILVWIKLIEMIPSKENFLTDKYVNSLNSNSPSVTLIIGHRKERFSIRSATKDKISRSERRDRMDIWCFFHDKKMEIPKHSKQNYNLIWNILSHLSPSKMRCPFMTNNSNNKINHSKLQKIHFKISNNNNIIVFLENYFFKFKFSCVIVQFWASQCLP